MFRDRSGLQKLVPSNGFVVTGLRISGLGFRVLMLLKGRGAGLPAGMKIRTAYTSGLAGRLARGSEGSKGLEAGCFGKCVSPNYRYMFVGPNNRDYSI